jgi:hypothetical protein
MPNLLDTGAAWLADQRHKHLATSVVYRHGDAGVVLSATIGRTEFASDAADPTIETWESRDYIVRTADITFGGQVMLPKRGDQIEETDGGVKYVYEVMAPAGQTPWRYADDFRRELRIHTKHVKTATA